MEEIVNRVAKSPLITLDLKEYQVPGERVFLDLKDWLFQELILREKDFRNHIREHDWEQYDAKHVAVACTADAIIPTWAYMLVMTKLDGHAATVVQGTIQDLERYLYTTLFESLDLSEFAGKKLVIKGCSDIPLPEYAFSEITKRLLPYVTSLMYGEPCSTVPIWKRSR
ncbi:MAG: DUF2480 family protein [Cyclobacteriaceae bacterium]